MSFNFSAKNYLDSDNGCEVKDCSSQNKGCVAKNILNSDRKCIWLSKSGLPQSITLDLSNLKQTQKISCFGIYCWHAYQTNPKKINLFVLHKYETTKKQNYTTDNSDDFVFYGTYELELVRF